MITMKEIKRSNRRDALKHKVILGLIFVIGLSIFLYPTVSNFIVSRQQANIIECCAAHER